MLRILSLKSTHFIKVPAGENRTFEKKKPRVSIAFIKIPKMCY